MNTDLCNHLTGYVICDSDDVGEKDNDRCHWQCIHCNVRGTEFFGENAFDLATAEAQMIGMVVS